MFGVSGKHRPGEFVRDLGPLLADFSLEMPGDISEFHQARALIPPGTRILVGFVGSEDSAIRVNAARTVQACGFVPVAVIAARRMPSEGALRAFLAGLRSAGASQSVLIVGGDPAQPLGPYPDAASVIASGMLEDFGVRDIGIAGHPGGHPAVAPDVLWSALAAKATVLKQQDVRGSVITQFAFDANLVLEWLVGVRQRGISLPARVSVPGPVDARRLLWYAARCGVSVSARIAEEYGFSLADPVGMVWPERFLRMLAAGYRPELHGGMRLHFNTFGGVLETARWIRRIRDG